MPARMRLTASLLLLLLVAKLWNLSSAVYHDYIIVGAGPGGLQLGYFLERAERDYVILERGSQAGAAVKRCLHVRLKARTWFGF